MIYGAARVSTDTQDLANQLAQLSQVAFFPASWSDFAALLFGAGALIALYISATNAEKRIAEAREEAAKASEHTAVLEKEAARLSAEAEASRAQIAAANARTAQAEVTLAYMRQFIVHREPDTKAMLQFLKQAKVSVEILHPKEDLEAAILARLLRDVLRDAGWEVSAVTPVTAVELADRKLWPYSWYLEAHSIPQSGMGSGAYLAFGTPLNGDPLDNSTFSLFVAALMVSLDRQQPRRTLLFPRDTFASSYFPQRGGKVVRDRERQPLPPRRHYEPPGKGRYGRRRG